MEQRSIEAVVRAFNEASVRYLIVGGLAVVAHGYVRFTADLDLILDLEENNLRRAVNALGSLGYRPRAPVALDQFIDAEKRAEWIREQGLTVFSLHSPDHPATEVDLFPQSPIDFARAYSAASSMEVAPGLPATFVGLEDLVLLKMQAGRPEDLEDIDRLRAVHREMDRG